MSSPNACKIWICAQCKVYICIYIWTCWCMWCSHECCMQEIGYVRRPRPPARRGARQWGCVRDVKTELLTSLAKYEPRMSSLELAHQCLMVWNTLIAFRKLDMSRHMEDASCLLRKNDSSFWFRAPTAVPGLSLLPGTPLSGEPVLGPPSLHAAMLLGATGWCTALPAAASVWEPALCGALAARRLAPPAIFGRFAGGRIRGSRGSRIIQITSSKCWGTGLSRQFRKQR